MSLGLVAYGASDDSDESENEYENASAEQSSQSNAISGHISDEDDFQTVSSSTSAPIFASRLTSKSKDTLVTADTSTTAFFNAKNYDNNVNSTSLTSLEDLPAPQPLSTSLSANIVEGELEDEVKPKDSEIANAQLPPTKKAKQPVKITIPSLNQIEDGESESDKSTAASSTSKKTGLFSLLPAPMHSVKKELNRPLIPHTLTKKPPVSNKSPSVQGNTLLSGSIANSASQKNKETDFSAKHMTPFNALTGFESDSDDEDFSGSAATNFFSLQSTSGTPRNAGDAADAQDKLQIEEISSSGTEATSPAGNDAPNTDSADVSNEESESVAALPPGPEPGALNDAPLDFGRINQLRSWPGSSYGFLPPVGPSGPITHGASASYDSSLSVPSNSQYNLANAEDEDMNAEDQEAMEEDDAMKLIKDKEFQRLQGKRKRGMEEAISFVDANVDDYVDPTEVSKHFTEESSYVSHKNKDNLPTAQQRRKKQITYLAYQAKEREMELKNTWAQNRLTKKQTQSKYGF